MKTPAIDDETKTKLSLLESVLSERIKGQGHAIPRIASVLKRGELGLTRPNRPKGSFLFLGATGVGKTEITLAFSEYLFGEGAVHRFDMSEYQVQDSLALLLGGNAQEEGMLGAAYRRSPKGTLLLDEIEKAHPRILDILLQMLDAARITLANGTTLDLSGFYIVLTSNIGSSQLTSLQHSSFATMERHVLAKAQQTLRPELFARINEKIVFNRLSYEVQVEIANALLDQEIAFLKGRGYEVERTDELFNQILREGFHSRLGARPLRNCVETLVAQGIIEQEVPSPSQRL